MKTTKIFTLLLCTAFSMGLYSCSDEADLQPIDKPALISTAVSYESLSFSWDAIPNAVQYGYRLSNESEGFSESGVTKQTQATFDGLQPATTYKLEVWAFAAVGGDYSSPAASEISATTDALIKLATPEATITISGSSFKATWTAVEYAEKYSYAITNSKNEKVKSGDTQKTSLSIRGLTGGEYTFSLTATTSEDGYENSDTFATPFKVEGSAPIDINDIYGSYLAWTTGMEADSNWKFQSFEYTDMVATLSKGEEDGKVILDGFYWEDCPVIGNVNLEEKKITFPHQIYYLDSEYGDTYILGSSKKAFGDMVATINDDGSVTIEDFGIWWEYSETGEIYKYAYGASDLIKNTPAGISMRKVAGKKANIPARSQKPQKEMTPPQP